MHYIYKFTNKTTKKTYIGQTNNIENRRRCHKSESYNEKSKGYILPFHCAIRKYGWDNFDFEVLEEIPDEAGYEYVDLREQFFIAEYKSLIDENGYNITIGGQGCPRKKITFEESVKLSKLFTLEEVKDIQQMLIVGFENYEIRKKYPQLSPSFLSNINTGFNFVREDLTYPLKKGYSHFSKETKEQIIKDIQNNIPYSQISKKYEISIGYISMINNGTKWHNDNYSYPLCKKICADGAWSHDLKYDLIFTNISHKELGEKYNRSKAAVTAINMGRNRRDNRFVYPLRSHQEENQKIWNTLF